MGAPVDIAILGANGDLVHVSGEKAGAEGVLLASKSVQGLWDAPVTTYGKSGRQQVGGSYKGKSNEWRDLTFGLHLFGDEVEGGWSRLESRVKRLFTFEKDPWDPDAKLARVIVSEPGRSRRLLRVQKREEPEFEPEDDPNLDEVDTMQFLLRAYQPMWEGRTDTESWSTTESADSGFVWVSNPTDQPLWHQWVLTRGTWSIPDFSWTGPEYARKPGGKYADRVLDLAPIDEVHGGARINLDPMRLDIESWSGTNLLGELAGRFFFRHVIPPYTPPTQLPIAVKDAPEGGARAELVMRRRWGAPTGLQ